MDMGDCNRELTMEIDSTMESIRLFSKRVEGLSDDMILYQAESLVEDIRYMIDAKKTIKENLEYKNSFLKDYSMVKKWRLII